MRKKPFKNTPQYTAMMRAIELAGGQAALRRKLGYKKPSCIVSNWVTRHFCIPEGKIIRVSKIINGAMTPEELRPDLFKTT